MNERRAGLIDTLLWKLDFFLQRLLMDRGWDPEYPPVDDKGNIPWKARR